MSDEKRNFVIVLDLSSFFHDHRRLARIFITKHIKTIQELQNRITEVFGIHGFYLSTGGHFLPTLENIKVLNNGETVYATPIKSNVPEQSNVNISLSTQTNGAGKRRQKTILDDIPEEYNEKPLCKKKRSKIHHNLFSQDSEGEPSKKLKVSHDRTVDDNIHKRSSKRVTSANLASVNQNYSVDSENQTKKDHQHQVQSTANEVLEIKKKLKQKTNEYSEKYPDGTAVKSTEEISDFKGILPKLQKHIKDCNKVGRSNLPDTVRLSRHVDTPLKTYTKRILPQRITDQYLAKNKVNIVKIDIIEQTPTVSDTTPNKVQNSQNINSVEQNRDPNSPPENYVKTVISCFEKNISPIEKLTEIRNGSIENGLSGQNEASNYTKTYLDQKDEEKILPEIKSETIRISSIPSTNSSISFITAEHETTFENQPKPLEEQPKPLEEQAAGINISQDISSIQDSSSISVNTSSHSTFNSTNISVESSNNCNRAESKHINTNKKYAGIGSLIEHLRESDSVFSPESDTSSQYVTKRKRIRKRKKKSKKTEEIEESIPISIIKIPEPKSIPKGCPNTHIKFESNDFDPTEPEIGTIITDGTVETPSHEKKVNDVVNNNQNYAEKNCEIASFTEIVLSDETEEPVLEIKSICGSNNIANAPLMENKTEPKSGDIIAFKILKMSESYSPQISGYIIGKVGMYQSASKTVYFKIIRGKEELLPVIGKLTSNLVEKEESSTSKYDWNDFKWNEILEPKLLYP